MTVHQTLPADETAPAYNYAYLDEQTKRMIRRALLKAVAVPGYQVPFGSREMPLARGWGTGGIQVTAAIIGPADTLKVIDQGADDTTNAVSIRRFFEKTADARTTEATNEATIIQTRHRIPEAPLKAGQIMVYQVPTPEPLRRLEPREVETRKMHAWAEYGLMQVKLYEDIARYGEITKTYDYPVMVNDRYVMAPSPIPKFDNPKMHMSPALQLFGAGREKRIYALPPAYIRPQPRFRGPSLPRPEAGANPARSAAQVIPISTRSSSTTRAPACSSAPTATIARRVARPAIAARCWAMPRQAGWSRKARHEP